MAITENQSAFVAQTATTVALSNVFTTTASSTNPAYVVLTALDRKEYTAASSGSTGSFTGNGHTLSFSNIGGDGRGAGIVFTYQSSTGRYYSTTYGYLDQLTYNSSGAAGDVANLSLFGTSNLSQANSYGANAYAMMQLDAAGYIGSATVVTQSKFSGSIPSQATPTSIAAIASTFVGQAWNMNGCWILTSTIAAEAGASLPVQSTAIGQAGQANGEWIVAYNGPTGQGGNWQSMVTAGEIIVIGTPGGGGHITTCVSGSGSSAMLIDNITYENSAGKVLNAANDGSSSDIIIAAPHAASQEWAGVAASSVVIYELDTPIVTTKLATDSLSTLQSQSLSLLFNTVDPAGKTIAQWQVYDSAITDTLLMGGVTYQDHTATSCLTTTSLAAVSLAAGSTATTDTLEVRAYNGTYWGDWTAFAVTVIAGAPAPAPRAPSAPTIPTQTAAQTWLGGKAFSLALPASTFTDPQGQALKYSATMANGLALPSWLSFNAATDTFSGTAPTTAQAVSIRVTATDTSLLSATDTFTATIIGTPLLAAPTANQTWTAGAAVLLSLPTTTFADPQGQKLTYTATQSNGQALPGWLSFNPATETFSGTAPATASVTTIAVTATDTSGLSATESFTATVQPAPTPAPTPAKSGITLTTQTPNQTWIANTNIDVILPSATFTDALGLKMSFAAFQISGTSVTSWLHFNAATDEFYGTVPATAAGTVNLEVIAMDSKFASATDLFSVTFAPRRTTALAATPSLAANINLPTSTAGMIALHA